MSLPYTSDSVQIREVWAENLDEEFALIREIVDDYPYISMDTEFPGVLVRSLGDQGSVYESLKYNVNLMKLIQLGLTFCNKEGHLPKCGAGDKYCIWQFNFREFNPDVDMHEPDSVKLLRQCGIDFEKNNKKGIDARLFGDFLISSGILLNDSVTWITFHNLYDFAYLLKVLIRRNLPEKRNEYLDLIDIYFPVFYDMKEMLKYSDRLHGGLENMATQVGLQRVGTAHQAGSDSLLASCLFKVVKDGDYLDRSLEDYGGVIYSLERLP